MVRCPKDLTKPRAVHLSAALLLPQPQPPVPAADRRERRHGPAALEPLQLPAPQLVAHGGELARAGVGVGGGDGAEPDSRLTPGVYE